MGLPVSGDAYSRRMGDLNRNWRDAVENAALSAQATRGTELQAMFQRWLAARQQSIYEMLLERQRPIEEGGALLRGGQMPSLPNFPQLPAFNINAPNIGQLHALWNQGL